MFDVDSFGCEKCLTEVNLGKKWCVYCSSTLNQTTFPALLEIKLTEQRQSAENFAKEKELLEAQKMATENAIRARIDRRSEVKKSMDEKELATFELLEDILRELQNGNKGARTNAATKAVLNAGATHFVENFFDEN